MDAPIVITGAAGWLGSRLVRALVDGLPEVPALAEPETNREIRCLLLPEEDARVLGAAGEPIRLHRGDIRDASSLASLFAGAEGGTLFHCAGVIHPARGTREFFQVNVVGTRNVLEAAASRDFRRAVVMSSNSPLGCNPSREHRFDEASPYRPFRGYGRSKMQMERAVAELQASGRIETVVVRAPWFYGPSQPVRQTRFFSMIRRGIAPIAGDGDNLRSMAYVDNLCQGLLLCARHPGAGGETYWIADRRPYRMNEIVDTVARLMADEFGMDVAGRRLRLPGWTSELAGLADGALQRVGLYAQGLHVLSEMNKTIACSIAKAERSLGYDPRIELEEGMRRSLRWCVDQGIEI